MKLIKKISSKDGRSIGGLIQYGARADYEIVQNKCQWQCAKCETIYGYREQSLLCAYKCNEVPIKFLSYANNVELGKKYKSYITRHDGYIDIHDIYTSNPYKSNKIIFEVIEELKDELILDRINEIIDHNDTITGRESKRPKVYKIKITKYFP